MQISGGTEITLSFIHLKTTVLISYLSVFGLRMASIWNQVQVFLIGSRIKMELERHGKMFPVFGIIVQRLGKAHKPDRVPMVTIMAANTQVFLHML